MEQKQNLPIKDMVLRLRSLAPGPLTIRCGVGLRRPEPPDNRRLSLLNKRTRRPLRELENKLVNMKGDVEIDDVRSARSPGKVPSMKDQS